MPWSYSGNSHPWSFPPRVFSSRWGEKKRGRLLVFIALCQRKPTGRAVYWRWKTPSFYHPHSPGSSLYSLTPSPPPFMPTQALPLPCKISSVNHQARGIPFSYQSKATFIKISTSNPQSWHIHSISKDSFYTQNGINVNPPKFKKKFIKNCIIPELAEVPGNSSHISHMSGHRNVCYPFIRTCGLWIYYLHISKSWIVSWWLFFADILISANIIYYL